MTAAIPPRRRNALFGRAAMSGIPIVDDAGVPRTLVRFGPEPAPDFTHPMTQGSLARLRSAAAARPRSPVIRWMVVLIVTSAVMMPTVVMGSVMLARWARLPPWALIGVLIGAVAVALGFALLVLPRLASRAMASRADLMVDALLRLRRCAACGYLLAADAEPNDGVHRCSECGATWNDARLGSVVVPDGEPKYSMSFAALLGVSAANRSRRTDDAGRLYAGPPRLSHSNMPKLPGDRHVWRATRGWLLFFVFSIPSGILMLLGAGLLLSASVNPTIPALMAMYALLVAPAAIISSLRNQRSLTRRALLCWRRCLACRGRLKRDGDTLHCPMCEATWKRAGRTSRSG